MPQRYTYYLEPDDERIFRFNTSQTNSISRFDVRGNALTHEAPLNLPSEIYEEDTNTLHRLSKITAIQPYNEKFFVAAQKENGSRHIFLVDEIHSNRVNGTTFDTPSGTTTIGQDVLDMTIWEDGNQRKELTWCVENGSIFGKRVASASSTVSPRVLVNDNSPVLARAITAYTERANDPSDNENYMVVWSKRPAKAAVPQSVTIRAHAADGTVEGITGTLKFSAPKAGIASSSTGTARPDIYIAFRSPTDVTNSGTASFGINVADQNKIITGVNNLSRTSTDATTSITITVQLGKVENSNSVTLNEIKAALDAATAYGVMSSGLEWEIEGNGEARVDWHLTQGNRGINEIFVAWKLGSANSLLPTTAAQQVAFGDWEQAGVTGTRPFSTAVDAVTAKNSLFLTDSTTGVAITSNKIDINRKSASDEDDTITDATGLAMLSKTKMLISHADGSVTQHAITITGTSPSTIDDSVIGAASNTVVDSAGYPTDTRTILGYEKKVKFLHVEGESIISLQSMTHATNNDGSNDQTITIYDGHDQKVELLQSNNARDGANRLTDINIPFKDNILSYDFSQDKGKWLLTTWSSK